MHWWRWILDVAGVVVVLLVLYGGALVARRRLISRHGGTFELSHRLHVDHEGRGWVLGLGRYSGETLEWWRVFSLSPRATRSWPRERLDYDGRREPLGSEQPLLYPDHLVIVCRSRAGDVELAMSAASLTGFQSWLEARPPGVDWSR